MKLVFIYGAPGVGKLTTGQALADLTGFKLFHNHLSFNLVRSIFEFPSPAFLELSTTVRLAAFDAAARARVLGLVFTFVYAAGADDPFVDQTVDAVQRHGGEVLFVRLRCDTATLEQRIVATERVALGKVNSVAWLRKAMAQWDFTATVPRRPSLDIDNSALSPEDVARRIARHFALPEAKEGARS